MDVHRLHILTTRCSPGGPGESRTRPQRAAGSSLRGRPRGLSLDASRKGEQSTARWVSTIALAASVAVAACSREVRHRTLTFFFDGVPALDAGITDLTVESPEDALVGAGAEAPRRVKTAKRFYDHPAYKQNRCPECHNVDGGGVLKTAREGLCQTCHPDKPEKKKFVHGPVAVNGCLACHLYHKSLHPKVLVADAQTLCFHCHEEGELRTDEHHATIKEERCIDCHDAHGGDDRFFLIPKADAVDAP